MLEDFKTGFHTVCHHYFLNLCLKWEFQIFYTCTSLPPNTMTVKDTCFYMSLVFGQYELLEVYFCYYVLL